MEKCEHLCTVGGTVNCYSNYGKQYTGSSKIKNRIDIWSSNLSCGYTCEEIINSNSKSYLHSHINYSNYSQKYMGRPEHILLCEMSDRERQTLHEITYMQDLKKSELVETENRLVVVRDWGVCESVDVVKEYKLPNYVINSWNFDLSMWSTSAKYVIWGSDVQCGMW